MDLFQQPKYALTELARKAGRGMMPFYVYKQWFISPSFKQLWRWHLSKCTSWSQVAYLLRTLECFLKWDDFAPDEPAPRASQRNTIMGKKSTGTLSAYLVKTQGLLDEGTECVRE